MFEVKGLRPEGLRSDNMVSACGFANAVEPTRRRVVYSRIRPGRQVIVAASRTRRALAIAHHVPLVGAGMGVVTISSGPGVGAAAGTAAGSLVVSGGARASHTGPGSCLASHEVSHRREASSAPAPAAAATATPPAGEGHLTTKAGCLCSDGSQAAAPPL